MRAQLFRAVLSRWEEKIPDWVQRIQLQILLNATAEGFGAKSIRIWHLPASEGLNAYGMFTKDCMKGQKTSPQRLYEVSCRLGARLRSVTGFTESADLEKLVFFLYRGIGITMTGCEVERLSIAGNKVTGVNARVGHKKQTFTADMVVLAAGGLGSPVILEHSGISCEKSLFVDPVLCVAGVSPDFQQDRQLLMPFISQQDGYILSPYIDYLSFFSTRNGTAP